MKKYLDANGVAIVWEEVKDKIDEETTDSINDSKRYTDQKITELKNDTTSTLNQINEKINNNSTNITSHTNNSTVHITTQERELWNTVSNKVDKVAGKGLSTNDYTTAEKNKLAGIETGAEVNVQSDWNVTDSTSDAFIKNKPYIPTKTSDLTNDSDYTTNTALSTAISNHNTSSTSHKSQFDAKFNKTDANSLIKNVEFDGVTGTLTFTKYDNTTQTIDLPTEEIVTDGHYDADKQELVLELANSGEIRIPATGLIDDYSGDTTASIQVNVSADNIITANIVGGGVTRTLLSTELQTSITNLETNSHKHNNSSILNSTTASYTTAEKTKLSGIEEGAEVNQNAFSNVTIGTNTISATSETDTINLVAGDNITLATDISNNKITISSTDTNTWRGIQNNLTSSSTTDSLSANQGKILKGLVDGKADATHTHTKNDITDFPTKLSEFINDAGFKTTDNNTTYSLGVSDNSATNGNVKVRLSDSSTNKYDVNIKGTGATTVTTNSDGAIIVNSTDTKYTHPTTSGNKHIPSGGSSDQILRWSADGTAVWSDENDTTYSEVTNTTSGLMSPADKVKLDGITSNADAVSFTQELTSGSQIGTITINGASTKLYAPKDTWRGIQDNLTSSSTTESLSANQGKILNETKLSSGALLTNEHLDDIKDVGLYYAKGGVSTVTGLPDDLASYDYFGLFVYKIADTYKAQQLTWCNYIYYRYYDGTRWYQWIKRPTVVDQNLSSTSANPVQNKTVVEGLHNIDPQYIQRGYTRNAIYLNTHPESGNALIPFMNNDIAHLLKRGGSAKIYYDGVEKPLDITNVFDGSSSYWAINPSGITEIVIELKLHKVFMHTNTIYVDHGHDNWRSKFISIETKNVTNGDTEWKLISSDSNTTIGRHRITFSASSGYDSIRFTFRDWVASDIFRIACLGALNYSSYGIREVCLPRDGGDMYGSIVPFTDSVYDLGTADNKWGTVYADNFIGDIEGSSESATNDAKGQQIDSTYIKDLSVSGQTITYTKGDGTTGTLTTQDTNTDTKVQQLASTSSAEYRVMLSVNANDTTETNVLRKSENFTANPSTGAFYAKGYNRIDLTGQTIDLNDLNISARQPHIMLYREKTIAGADNITNMPVSSQPFILDVELVRAVSDTDYITRQTFVGVNERDCQYVRWCTNGTWSEWVKDRIIDTYEDVTGLQTALDKKMDCNIHKALGTSGSHGYVAFAQIKIKATYTNKPIEFTLTCRGGHVPCRVSVRYVNGDTKDPDLNSLLCYGHDYGVFIQKVEEGTWKLWYKKFESYDSIDVMQVINPYTTDLIEITYLDEFTTEEPTENVTKSTLGYSVGNAKKATTAETANKATTLDGLTSTITELNYCDGVTSNIQTQLDGKASSSHNHSKSQIGDFNKQLKEEDLDTVTGVGFYFGAGGNAVVNRPSGVDAFGLIVLKSAGGWYTQLLYASNNKQEKLYTRWYEGGTWTGWKVDTSVTGISIGSNSITLTKSDGTTEAVGTDWIPMAGSTDIRGTLRTSGELQSTNPRGLRLVNGDYGAILRNDGSGTFLLLTDSGDQYGDYNSLRPISINNSTGMVTFAQGLSGNLTGNADSATKLTTSAGSSMKPVYFSGGKPVACGFTIEEITEADIDTMMNS